MPTSPRELADRFGYPEELTGVLDALVALVSRSARGRHALVLSGSVATGDFVWRVGETGTRLLSDLDATLYVEGEWAGRPELDSTIARLEREMSSPLFHIDLSVQSMQSLDRIEERFQHVEARLAGIVLCGEDVFERYPERVDARAARQSTLNNLWKCVLNWPGPVDGVQASDVASDEAYRIALSRTILDLPILVWSEKGECLPGHRQRCESFLASPDDEPLINDATRDAVRLGLEMRSTGAVGREALEQAARTSVCAAMALFGVPPDDVFSASPEVVRRIAAIVPERTPRRFLGESRGLWPALGGPLRSLAWWLRRKEPVGAAALLGLFAYTVSGGEGDPSRAIADRLSEYSGLARIGGRGAEFVSAARRTYWRGRCRLNPSDAAKADFYSTLLVAGAAERS